MTTFGSMTIGGEGAIELEFHSSCSGAYKIMALLLIAGICVH